MTQRFSSEAGIKKIRRQRMPVYSVGLKLTPSANAQPVGVPDGENRKERESE